MIAGLRNALRARLIRWLALTRSRRRFVVDGCRFAVSPGVLNPTAFRSSLVFAEAARRAAGPTPGSVLELGCGSGVACIPLAVRGHEVTAVDRSLEAIHDTRSNAARNSVSMRILCTDWDAGLDPGRTWDLVIANPPFLPTTTPVLRRALWAGPQLESLAAALESMGRRIAPSGQGVVLSSERTGRDRFLELVRQAGLAPTATETHRIWGECFFVDLVRRAEGTGTAC